MIKLIATALLEAFHALGRKDDFGYAFHCGEAGGIAAAAAAFGVRALELCDDISDAYEEADRGFMRCILEEMLERPGGNEGDDVRTRETNFHALEFGAILQVAMEAKREGDDLRYSLMIGFTTGLMFRCQDPDGDVERTVLAKILEGYRTDSYELLRQAHGTLGFVAQMRDLMSLMGKSEAARYYEERVRSLHWLRNFGLRDSRSRDYTIVIPNALLINFRLWQQGGENEEIPVVGDEVDYQAVEFFDEEDSVPFDDLDKSIVSTLKTSGSASVERCGDKMKTTMKVR